MSNKFSKTVCIITAVLHQFVCLACLVFPVGMFIFERESVFGISGLGSAVVILGLVFAIFLYLALLAAGIVVFVKKLDMLYELIFLNAAIAPIVLFNIGSHLILIPSVVIFSLTSGLEFKSRNKKSRLKKTKIFEGEDYLGKRFHGNALSKIFAIICVLLIAIGIVIDFPIGVSIFVLCFFPYVSLFFCFNDRRKAAISFWLYSLYMVFVTMEFKDIRIYAEGAATFNDLIHFVELSLITINIILSVFMFKSMENKR